MAETLYQRIYAAFAAGEGTKQELAVRFDVGLKAVQNAIYLTRKRAAAYSGCERKVRYEDADGAQAALDRLRLDRPDDPGARECRVYPCKFCGGFHFGRPSGSREEASHG